MPVLIIKSLEQFEEIINGDNAAVMDFWAEWCIPCKAMSPLFEALSEEYASSEVVFGKVNIDDHGLIAKRYDIASIPTFIYFKKGSVGGIVKGAEPQALKDLVAKAAAGQQE